MAGLDIINQGPDMFERQTDLVASGNVRRGLHESGRAPVDDHRHAEKQQKRNP
jgi:hypothetical protein